MIATGLVHEIWCCGLYRFTSSMMKSICETLDLERGGKKEDLVDRIMSFLMDPKSSGKPLPSSTVKRKCQHVSVGPYSSDLS